MGKIEFQVQVQVYLRSKPLKHIFCRPVIFRGEGKFCRHSSQSWWTKLYRILGGRRHITGSPQMCFKFPTCSSIEKAENLKGDLRLYFAVLLSPCKISGGWAKCLRQFVMPYLGSNH